VIEGIQVKRLMNAVVSRGRVIIDNGNLTGKPGAGEFLRRQT
jgi:hypothetical protein